MEDKELRKILITHVSRMRDHLDELVQRGEKSEQIKRRGLAFKLGRLKFLSDIRIKDPVNPPPSVVTTADLNPLVKDLSNLLTDLKS